MEGWASWSSVRRLQLSTPPRTMGMNKQTAFSLKCTDCFFFFFLIFRAFIFHLQRNLHNLWLIVQLENFFSMYTVNKCQSNPTLIPWTDFFLTFWIYRHLPPLILHLLYLCIQLEDHYLGPSPEKLNRTLCLSATASINNCSYSPHLLSANFAWTLTSKPTLLIPCIVHQNLVKHLTPLQTYYRL